MIATNTKNKLGITDYDFNLSKLERVMSGAGKVAALGHELERRGLRVLWIPVRTKRRPPATALVGDLSLFDGGTLPVFSVSL